MEEEFRILVCYRVADLKKPNLLSVVRKCSRCGERIYIMPKNLTLKMSRMCHQCAIVESKKHDEVFFRPASALFSSDKEIT